MQPSQIVFLKQLPERIFSAIAGQFDDRGCKHQQRTASSEEMPEVSVTFDVERRELCPPCCFDGNASSDPASKTDGLRGD
jgi:hypothetical protein